MTSYIDKNEYKGTVLKTEIVEEYLKKASKHVDVLTFNRIVGKGFKNLTTFQQSTIKDVVCSLAEFEYENEDLLTAIISNYSINSVSMSLENNWNLKIEQGISIPQNLYSELQKTGLTCKNGRY